MRKKSTRRPRRDEKQWAEIFRRFESGEPGSREFCRREGLALSSFQRWRRRVGSTASHDFVELVPAAQPSVASSSWSLDVALPNGVSLRFEG